MHTVLDCIRKQSEYIPGSLLKGPVAEKNRLAFIVLSHHTKFEHMDAYLGHQHQQ